MIDDRGDLDLTKQIEVLTKRVQEAELETSLVKSVGMNSPEMNNLKKEINTLKARVKEAELETSIFFEAINKNSLQLLSLLQQIEDVKKEADNLMMNKIIFYEKELLRVKYDNKKLANQITEMISRLKDANF
jgi:uncharacterized coiled-coil DUF342 family protein|tara:strand:- start:1249 stop:1644 length:396 start_codon:yes stop_codon:yes gene_type:complete